NEALQPHADEHNERDEPEPAGGDAELLQPENLRDKNVAGEQRHVRQPIRAVEPVPEQERIELAAAVPAHERLHAIAVGNDEAGGQHDLSRVLEMPHGDEVLQPVDRADWNRKTKNHGETGINGARDKVRWEDRGVPAGDDADGEIEADDREYGKH